MLLVSDYCFSAVHLWLLSELHRFHFRLQNLPLQKLGFELGPAAFIVSAVGHVNELCRLPLLKLPNSLGERLPATLPLFSMASLRRTARNSVTSRLPRMKATSSAPTKVPLPPSLSMEPGLRSKGSRSFVFPTPASPSRRSSRFFSPNPLSHPGLI